MPRDWRALCAIGLLLLGAACSGSHARSRDAAAPAPDPGVDAAGPTTGGAGPSGGTVSLPGVQDSGARDMPGPEPSCVDGDGDGYGQGCFLGFDCDDTDDTSTDECIACNPPFGLDDWALQRCPAPAESGVSGTFHGLYQLFGAGLSGDCGFRHPDVLTDAGPQETFEAALPPIARSCLCDRDYLDLHDLFWRADLPPGTSIVLSACWTNTQSSATCDWQPLVTVSADRTCESQADCAGASVCRRNSEGPATCRTTATTPCQGRNDVAECGATPNARCSAGQCTHQGPPADIERYLRDDRAMYWYVKMSFVPSADGLAPTIHTIWLTLSCTVSV